MQNETISGVLNIAVVKLRKTFKSEIARRFAYSGIWCYPIEAVKAVLKFPIGHGDPCISERFDISFSLPKERLQGANK